MYVLRTLSVFGSIAIGTALALVCVAPIYVLLTRPTSSTGDRQNANGRPPSVSTQDHGASARMADAQELMRRLAKDFVASAKPPSSGERVFYEQPIDADNGLCQIIRYRFAPAIAAGKPFKYGDWPDGKLKVDMAYGVWAEPGSTEAQGDAGELACANYRDFDHLISGENTFAIMRAANVLARAARYARLGQVKFKVDCIDRRRTDAYVACDGLALLRETRAKDIRQVSSLDRPSEDPDHYDSNLRSAVYVDQVQMDARSAGDSCGRSEALTYKLTTLQEFGKYPAWDGEPLEIRITRDIIC